MSSHSLDELDEPKASLRILVTLSSYPQGINVTKLYKTMKAGFGLGRTAIDTSIKALITAGLVVKYDYEEKNLKILDVTAFGEAILRKVLEVAEMVKKNRD